MSFCGKVTLISSRPVFKRTRRYTTKAEFVFLLSAMSKLVCGVLVLCLCGKWN